MLLTLEVIILYKHMLKIEISKYLQNKLVYMKSKLYKLILYYI